jgi:PAS domain S-box-containing protein
MRSRLRSRARREIALADAGITSSLSLVISTGPREHIHGMISLHSTQPRIFSEDETVFLESVAIALGQAIARKRSDDELRALVEHSPDPIVRFDGELRITYLNPAAECLTGRPAESLLGRTSLEIGILVEPAMPTWELVLRQVWRTRREHTTEVSLMTAQGERILQIRILPGLF